MGTHNNGGGAIGAIVATPLIKLLGGVGATILAVAIAVITAMYI